MSGRGQWPLTISVWIVEGKMEITVIAMLREGTQRDPTSEPDCLFGGFWAAILKKIRQTTDK